MIILLTVCRIIESRGAESRCASCASGFALRLWINHNNIYREWLHGPGSGRLRIPAADAVQVAELSVVQSPIPGGIRSFRLGVEPNSRSLEISPASEWTRGDVKFLAVFSYRETKLFF